MLFKNLGLNGDCIDETIVINPFQPAVYVYRDYGNEVGVFRVLENYVGLLYEDQMTLHLTNRYLDCTYGPEKYIFSLLEHLGLEGVVRLSKIWKKTVTFSFVIHPNKEQIFSSVTFFCGQISTARMCLRGKFSGVFNLKTKHSLAISTNVDSLISLGFYQLTRFFEEPDSPIQRIYPHFRNFCVEVERGEELVEVVEKMNFSEEFLLEEHSQTAFKCSLSHDTDPTDSDLITKTFFFGYLFPAVWLYIDRNGCLFIF